MAISPDLWGKLIALCDQHEVEFKWVRGHSGNPENERCDRLAVQAANQSDLMIDEIYESPSEQNPMKNRKRSGPSQKMHRT